MLTELAVRTGTQAEFVDITLLVQEVVRAGGVTSGLCSVCVPHTTAGLTLNENWDPTVRGDIVRALQRIVPSSGDYRHVEGNSPAHIRATLTGFSATVPIAEGQLVLGTWQGIYLAEFDGPRERRVLVTVLSD